VEENVDGVIEATVSMLACAIKVIQATYLSVTICEGGANCGRAPTLIFRCSGRSLHQALIFELCSRAQVRALEEDKSHVGL
jgi:hypothetical protein